MSKIRLFCAECGNTDASLFQNFCQNCYWRLHSLAKPTAKEVNIPVCIECTSVKLPSGWQKFPDEEEMKSAIAHASSKLLNLSSGLIVDIENSIIDWDLPKLSFLTTYFLEDDNIDQFDPHNEEYTFQHNLDKGVCKACTIKKTGARNVTVQLRAANRNLDNNEKNLYRDLAIKSIGKSGSDLHTNYLSKVEEYHGGLDYIFGNTQVAENFLHELEKHVIGEREKNYKLVTEDKEGKRIYSITYLYRIPEFRPNDYVGLEDTLYRVDNVSSRGIQLVSLKDGQKTLTKDYKNLILANEQIQRYKKIVLSEDIGSNSYLIMDASTFENEEVLIDNFRSSLPIGEEVLFINWRNKYFLE